MCGAPKSTFQTKEVTVAGFAQNQKCAHCSPMPSSQAANQLLCECARVLSWMTICGARLRAHTLQAHVADTVLVVCRYGLGSNSMTEGQKCAGCLC